MSYYSDPTAAKALGGINREFARLEKKAKKLKKQEKNGKIWKAGKLDDRLTEAFGDKEMIILS